MDEKVVTKFYRDRKYTEAEHILNALIDATPTGEARSLLTDANIALWRAKEKQKEADNA